MIIIITLSIGTPKPLLLSKVKQLILLFGNLRKIAVAMLNTEDPDKTTIKLRKLGHIR